MRRPTWSVHEACGKLVLGDKANPQTTFHLNEGHVTDMCEIGGDLQSQRDVHYEVKVPGALTKTRQAGQGSAAHAGCCASLGHKFGFGSTLDQTLLKVLGCKERGHKSQGPLVHATGKGWVKEHKGQYYDALHVKNGIVREGHTFWLGRLPHDGQQRKRGRGESLLVVGWNRRFHFLTAQEPRYQGMKGG